MPGSPPRTKYDRTIIVAVGVPGDAEAPGSSLGPLVGSPDGADDGLAEPLGAGVRSGLDGSADGLGVETGVGTSPSPPVDPAQAARAVTSSAGEEDRSDVRFTWWTPLRDLRSPSIVPAHRRRVAGG